MKTRKTTETRLTRGAMGIALTAACLFGLSQIAGCGKKPAPVVTGNARVDKLLSQMTLEEKMGLIRGGTEDQAVYQGQAGYLPGVPRLGIPGMRFADGPPGVLSRHPSQAETATMGVAATFSREDAEKNGEVIGREARSLGIDVALQPFINIDRDITFARGYNTFGEDPMLTGAIGAAEIKGIQSQHVMAQAKHFVAYDTDSYNVYVDEQTLHEVYVAPFADAVGAGVSSIMCSYNKVNGTFACGNSHTLIDILRKEVGFKGFVTSDWGAVHAVDFINHGLDVEMPGRLPAGSPLAGLSKSYFATQEKAAAAPPPSGDAITGLLGGNMPEEPAPHFDFSGFPRESVPGDMADALQKGLVTEATITAAAGRVLLEMERFGYLDGQEKHEVTDHATEENAKVIEKTAEDAAVLLKNEGGALPLKQDELSTVALIGPGAGQVVAIGTSGERSEGLPERQIGPLAAMEKISNEKIAYAVADDMTGVPIPAGNFSHEGKSGLERMDADGKANGEDAEIDFTKANGKALAANSKMSWKGRLTIAKAGSYWLYLQLMGAYGNLKIDGKMAARSGVSKGGVHGDIVQANHDNVLPTTDGLDNVRRAVELSAGTHEIEVAVSGDSTNDVEQVRLNWQTPEQRAATHDAAIATARKAKKAIVFVWTRGKPNFALPGDQDKLIEEISAVNRNTVVVLNVSQPVALPWLGKVKGVLQMWWPGDEGGWATANLLLGKTSPAGRLPFTWAKKLEDYPATDPAYPERSAKGVDGKTTYSEGVNIGYRWFDEKKIAPLFPFGFGLSYTKFEYSNLQVSKATDGGLDVHLTLKNVGRTASDEVPQVYLGRPANLPDGVQSSHWTLAGFDRVRLEAGETRDVAIHVPLRKLQYWSVGKSEWVTPQGNRKVSVGASSRDLQLEGNTQ